jgi:hypothetical protein
MLSGGCSCTEMNLVCLPEVAHIQTLSWPSYNATLLMSIYSFNYVICNGMMVKIRSPVSLLSSSYHHVSNTLKGQ